MAVRKRGMISGSARLENEQRIAEAIAKRSEELRASLSIQAKEHAAFRDKLTEEKRVLSAGILKAKAELARAKKEAAAVKMSAVKLRDEYSQGIAANARLQGELETKLRALVAEVTRQAQKTAAIAKREEELKTRIASKEADVAARERSAIERELRADTLAKKQITVARNLAEQERNLALLSAEYALRVSALRLKENKAEAILAREAAVTAEETRLDIKGKLIQENGKKQKIERAALARERARLGRIGHTIKRSSKNAKS